MRPLLFVSLGLIGYAYAGSLSESARLEVAPREDRLPGVSQGAVEVVLGVRVAAGTGRQIGVADIAFVVLR